MSFEAQAHRRREVRSKDKIRTKDPYFPAQDSWIVRVYCSCATKATCASAMESHKLGILVLAGMLVC
jgi:type IV secretory pathway TrbF-like protein